MTRDLIRTNKFSRNQFLQIFKSVLRNIQSQIKTTLNKISRRLNLNYQFGARDTERWPRPLIIKNSVNRSQFTFPAAGTEGEFKPRERIATRRRIIAVPLLLVETASGCVELNAVLTRRACVHSLDRITNSTELFSWYTDQCRKVNERERERMMLLF